MHAEYIGVRCQLQTKCRALDMKTKKPKRKKQLYGKEQPRFPKVVSAGRDKGFTLRAIESADRRFAVVRQIRKRLKTLKRDAGVDTFGKECLAGRAVFILSYLESLEYDAVHGKPIEWKLHLQATKSLSDLLSKLGLDQEAKSATSLNEYVDAKKSGKR